MTCDRHRHASSPSSQREAPRLSRRAFLRLMALASVAVGLAAPAQGGRQGPGQPKTPGVPGGEGDGGRWGKRRPTHVPAQRAEGDGAEIPPADVRFVAWDRRCGHPSCVALAQPGLDRMVCPCYGGHPGARTGWALCGPPLRPVPGNEQDHQPEPGPPGGW